MSGSVTGYLVQDLVTLALRQIGVGAQGTLAGPPDIADGVMHLNMMLAQWQRRRWMVPCLRDYSCIATGALSYSVGPAGSDIVPNGYRPDEIDSCYIRWLANLSSASDPGDFDPTDFSADDFDTGSVLVPNEIVPGGPLALDHPLTLIPSREDYSNIRIKNLQTWPSFAFYTPTWPIGTLYVWPVPIIGQWEIHIVCKQALGSNLTATSPITLPPEYWDAIMWCLAARLAPSYGQEASATVATFAKAAIQTIKGANTEIPLLEMPREIMPRYGSGGYGAWWFGGGPGGPTSPVLGGGTTSGGGNSAGGSGGTTTVTGTPLVLDTGTFDSTEVLQ